MDLQLRDKRFLVTGASSGIGQATSRVLAEEGADVVVCYGANREGAEATASQVAACGRRAWLHAFEQTDDRAIETALGEIRNQTKTLGGLVLCAGLSTITPFEQLSADEWCRFIDINLNGTFRVLRAARPLLGRGASIVIVASVSGQTGAPHHAHYAAAKAGLINLTKSAARAYAEDGIRVNCIAPGMTLTPMGANTARGLPSDYAKTKLLAGRFAQPEEIAKCIVFLASPLTEFISGATLDVNGGRLLR